ncbi:MAG: hypothetical protein P8Z35_12040 [Ignavibacteriaceae bacterium]|jgi:hypothetical protein
MYIAQTDSWYLERITLLIAGIVILLTDRAYAVCADRDMTIQEFVTDAIIEKLQLSYKERRKTDRL